MGLRRRLAVVLATALHPTLARELAVAFGAPAPRFAPADAPPPSARGALRVLSSLLKGVAGCAAMLCLPDLDALPPPALASPAG